MYITGASIRPSSSGTSNRILLQGAAASWHPQDNPIQALSRRPCSNYHKIWLAMTMTGGVPHGPDMQKDSGNWQACAGALCLVNEPSLRCYRGQCTQPSDLPLSTVVKELKKCCLLKWPLWHPRWQWMNVELKVCFDETNNVNFF